MRSRISTMCRTSTPTSTSRTTSRPSSTRSNAQPMSTAEVAANKALFRRFHEAANTGDFDFLAKTIDELVAPDAVIRTPLPIDATGAEALKQIWAMLMSVYPDIHLT